MRRLSVWAIAGVLVWLTACSPYQIRRDYDPEADFSGLKTFGWLVPEKDSGISQPVLKRVQAAVQRELEKKGFRVSPDNPDFWVAIHEGDREKIRVADWGYRYSSHYRNGYWAARDIDVFQYEEGTLILDMIEAGSKALLWRGEARGSIDPVPTPERQERRIGEAVAELLKAFPPTGTQ